MGYQLPEEVPAWHVEIYWYSSIVGHIAGWNRAHDHKGEKTFRSKAAAVGYARRMTGTPSFLVPYMLRRGSVVETTRAPDWRDRLAAWINQKPAWTA